MSCSNRDKIHNFKSCIFQVVSSNSWARLRARSKNGPSLLPPSPAGAASSLVLPDLKAAASTSAAASFRLKAVEPLSEHRKTDAGFDESPSRRVRFHQGAASSMWRQPFASSSRAIVSMIGQLCRMKRVAS